jgi:hypothetical protein
MTDLDTIEPSARELLRAWGRASLPDDRLRRVGEQLFAVRGTIAADAGRSSALRKIVGGVLGVGIAVLVLAAVVRPNEDPRRPAPAFSTMRDPVVGRIAAPPIAPPPLAPIVIRADEPATISAKPVARRRSQTEVDPLAAEIALVDRIESRLRADEPAHALRLADRHAKRFAKGVFRDEVEVLRADALCRLGERQRARLAVEAFTASRAGSPLAHRMSSICR